MGAHTGGDRVRERWGETERGGRDRDREGETEEEAFERGETERWGGGEGGRG